MPEYKFTDETATTVVLHSLINDMKHILEWLTIGLFAVGIASAIRCLFSVLDHEWIAVGLNGFCAVIFAMACVETARRKNKYRGAPR